MKTVQQFFNPIKNLWAWMKQQKMEVMFLEPENFGKDAEKLFVKFINSFFLGLYSSMQKLVKLGISSSRRQIKYGKNPVLDLNFAI